jgi:hypothetical protein
MADLMCKRQITLCHWGCQSCFFRKNKRLGVTAITDMYPRIQTGYAASANPPGETPVAPVDGDKDTS